MSANPLFFRSESIPWTSGGVRTVGLDFLPTQDKRKGRIIIDRLLIRAVLNLTTPGGVTLLGPDHWGFVKRLIVKDSIGIRRNLTGMKLRTQAYKDMGARVPADPATFAAATTADATVDMVVNFERPRSERPRDFGIPVDDLQDGGGIELQMPAASDIFSTGGALTSINAGGTYVFIAECHAEHDLQFKSRDCVVDHTPSSQTDVQVPISGRLVRDVTMVREGAGGGLTMAGLTDVSCEPYLWQNIPRAHVLNSFNMKRDVAAADGNATVDPFAGATNRAFPLVFVPEDAQIPDMLLIQRNLLIRLTSTITDGSLIVDTIASRSEDYVRRVLARWGKPQNSKILIKTAQPSRHRAPKDWKAYRGFMPAKVA